MNSLIKNGVLVALLLISKLLTSQTIITMQKEGGVYTVPCKINGVSLKFIFDTGASDVSISLTEAAFMIKNGYITKEDIGESVYYSIANGDVAKGTKLNIKEIEFAGLRLFNVEASIVHETSAPLLLGQSAIEKLGKIQLDGNKLTILNAGRNNYNFETTSINLSDNLPNGYYLLNNDAKIWSERDARGNLVATLPKGTKIKMINRKYDWIEIEFNGRFGWTAEKNIDLPSNLKWVNMVLPNK